MGPITKLALGACCVALLTAAGRAPAQEPVAMPDGSTWRQNGARMIRMNPKPELVVNVDFFPLDINCAAGMLLSNTDRPAFLGAGYYPKTYLEQAPEGSFATVCTETAYQTLVVELSWQGTLTAQDSDAFRTFLPAFAAGAEASVASAAWAGPPPLQLFASGARVRMTPATGYWVNGGDASETTVTLIKRWPYTEPVGIALQRGPESCAAVGAGGVPATWAPAGYSHGTRDGDVQFACTDLPSGYVAASMLDEHTGRDEGRVRALLTAIATALGAPRP